MPKLVASMSWPLMVSLLIQSLYNIVDSIFVARLSEDALTATSLAFPMQLLMIAVGVGTRIKVEPLVCFGFNATTIGIARIGMEMFSLRFASNPHDFQHQSHNDPCISAYLIKYGLKT